MSLKECVAVLAPQFLEQTNAPGAGTGASREWVKLAAYLNAMPLT